MQLPPSRSSRAKRRGGALAATAVACLGISALAATGATAATPAQIDAAVARGADYLESRQMPNGTLGGVGDFGGDWAASSLAAAGRDAGAIRVDPSGPSLLDAYRTLWTSGPDGEEDWTTPSGPVDVPVRPASDYSRALIIGQALGLEPTRLAADQNLVAQLAGLYHGRPAGGEDPDAGRVEGNLGKVAAFDGAVSGLQALTRTAVPQVLLDTVAAVVRSNQFDNGSWDWVRVTSTAQRADPFAGDIDMTAQAVSALCDAGVRPSDPAIDAGLSFLRATQIANGGFAPSWGPAGNTNSTAIVVLALNACGIDPQSAAWTSPEGKTPLDHLVSQQLDSGAFGWETGGQDENFYATQEALRALTGSGYAVTPRRTVAAPKVADGTVVPQALVVDAGIDETGERDLRFCRVSAPIGATVAQLLEAAATSAQPAGCVTGLSVQDGVVRALNGVTGDDGQRTWLARVEAGAPRRAGDQPVCQGQIVSLYVGRAIDAASGTPAPCTAAEAPVDPAPQPPSPSQPSAPAPAPPVAPQAPVAAAVAAPTPRLTVAGRKGTRSVRLDRKGRIRITLRCPANAGKRGCWSVVEARSKYRATPRGEARDRRVGGRTIRLSAGRSRTVTVTLSPALRRDLRRVGSRRVRFIVRTTGDVAGKTSRTALSVGVRPAARG